MTDMRYMDHLDVVVTDAVGLIREKTGTYGDSWKRRGGPGAWFTTVRPIDRLEGIMARHDGDIFAAIEKDPTGRDGSALACVRDIMNYCILIEAHARAVLGVGSHGPEREAGCEWCGRPVPGVGGGVFCTTGCSDAKWEHDHRGEPYHPPSSDKCTTFECDQCGRDQDLMLRWVDLRSKDTHFCSELCARRYHAESEPSPASGSHHAVEPAGEDLQDTERAGDSGADLRSLPPLERLEGFEKAVRLLGILFGVAVSCTDNVGHGKVTTIRVSPLD